MGKYRSFKELLKKEKLGKDFKIITKERKSEIAIIASHGGGIEPVT